MCSTGLLSTFRPLRSRPRTRRTPVPVRHPESFAWSRDEPRLGAPPAVAVLGRGRWFSLFGPRLHSPSLRLWGHGHGPRYSHAHRRDGALKTCPEKTPAGPLAAWPVRNEAQASRRIRAGSGHGQDSTGRESFSLRRAVSLAGAAKAPPRRASARFRWAWRCTMRHGCNPSAPSARSSAFARWDLYFVKSWV